MIWTGLCAVCPNGRPASVFKTLTGLLVSQSAPGWVLTGIVGLASKSHPGSQCKGACP